MKCIDPVICYALASGKKIWRHFSLAHKFRLQKPLLVTNCGKCTICRKKKAAELATRCVLHASLYERNCFITLTYDEKKSTYHNNFDYTDIQKFKKRLRQHCMRKKNGRKKIQIFNVHEYGKKGKKHWHLIVFNHDFSDKESFPNTSSLPLYTSAGLARLWPHGFNSIGDVSEASAMYQAQYMEKDLKNGNLMSHKKSHSKHSGLGRPYFLKNYKQILSLGFIPIGNRKVPVPRYFQKLAHKHYCHYYDQSAFHQTRERKPLYRPFKKEKPNLEIANLYQNFKMEKEKLLPQYEQDWDDIVTRYLIDKAPTDFQKSGSNLLYDLANKPNGGTL